MPDGKQIDKEIHVPAKDITWSKEKCDVHFGNHYCKGDLKHYEIHIDLIDGMAADLVLDSTAKPYRPGTSYFQFGYENKYYTWFCVVPRGNVSVVVYPFQRNTKIVQHWFMPLKKSRISGSRKI